jgi:uncharacterized RDD family membrane protein YckC
MRPSTRHALVSLVANVALAALCVALFLGLPFGFIGSGIVSGLVWIIGGTVVDRRLLARLSPEERADELRRRNDSVP